MKRKWTSPTTQVQGFVPNEYVAACYHVVCQTDASNGYYTYIYDDTNKNGELDSGDVQINNGTRFRGCGTVHTSVLSDKELAFNGFVSTRSKDASSSSGTVTRVFWWNQAATGFDSHHVCYNPTSAERQDPSRPNAS